GQDARGCQSGASNDSGGANCAFFGCNLGATRLTSLFLLLLRKSIGMDNQADRHGQGRKFRFHGGVLLGGLEGTLHNSDSKRRGCEMSNAIKCLLTKPSRRRAAAWPGVRLSWFRRPPNPLFIFVKIRDRPYVFRKILFVCVGNICRSPTAELLMRRRLQGRSNVEVSSAGLQALVGRPVDPQAATLLRENGIDPDSHVARQSTPSVLVAADLVLVMEQSHHARIVRE